MIHLLQSLADGSTQLVDVPVPAATGVFARRRVARERGIRRYRAHAGRFWARRMAGEGASAAGQGATGSRQGAHRWHRPRRSARSAPSSMHRSRSGIARPGVVVETGPRVERFAPGDRVVTNGPHAEYVRVSHTLAAHIPDGVSFETAAFTPLAAIGLQGLRLAAPTLGETVVVYGLGLIGLLTVQLARANGCEVIGIDRDPSRLTLAERFGARTVAASEGVDVARAVLDLTGGRRRGRRPAHAGDGRGWAGAGSGRDEPQTRAHRARGRQRDCSCAATTSTAKSSRSRCRAATAPGAMTPCTKSKASTIREASFDGRKAGISTAALCAHG